MVAAKIQLFSSVIESRPILGLPLRPSALGRAVSQLAGLLGPAALRALVWPFGPLLSIPKPSRFAPFYGLEQRARHKKMSSYFPQSSCSVIPMIYPKLN